MTARYACALAMVIGCLGAFGASDSTAESVWSLSLPAPGASGAQWNDWSYPAQWEITSAPDGEVAATHNHECEGSTTIANQSGQTIGSVSGGAGYLVATGEPDRWLRWEVTCTTSNVQLITGEGQVLWSRSLPFGFTPINAIVGGAGTIFVVTCHGGCSIEGGETIFGLASDTGAIRFESSFPIQSLGYARFKGVWWSSEAVAATPEGAVLVHAGTFIYLDGNGHVLHSGSVSYKQQPVVAVNSGGEVLIASVIPTKHSGERILHEANKGQATLVGADGKVRWHKSITLPGNAYARILLAAAPNNVWVIADDSNDSGDSTLPSVVGIGSGGTRLWSARVTPASGNWLPKSSQLVLAGVDATGHVGIDALGSVTCSVETGDCHGGQSLVSTLNTFNTDTGELTDQTALPVGSLVSSISNGQIAAVAYPTGESGQARLQSYATSGHGSSYPLLPDPPATRGSYVALGDSYSSGEGNPPYEDGTDEEGIPDLCHRSSSAYGPLLDAALALGPMIFKACSGAVTNDFFDSSANDPSEPPQFSWLTGATKTVTLTVGGNDAGFPWVLRHCVVWVPPLPNNFGCSLNAQLESETQARLAALAGGAYATTPQPQSEPIHSVLSVIQGIHDRAPTAHIVVGLYPTLFGPSKKNYALTLAPGFAACEVGNILGDALWIGYEDAKWLNERGEQLNQIIMDAVAAAAHQGIAVGFAEPNKFAHHRFCDKAERWFHPLSLEIKHLPELEPELPSGVPSSFHPTEAGQLSGYESTFAKKLR